jgi:hypothetical protein
MKHMQRERLKTFLTIMKTQKDVIKAVQYIANSDDMKLSETGCLRWVYESNYMNDGQERFEASDDVSFDVRGSFCSFCELSRRLSELRPVFYETPTEEHIPERSTEGFTQNEWVWKSEPKQNVCEVISVADSLKVCELSSDLFRTLLSLFIVDHVNVFRNTCFAYTCGSKQVFVTENVKSEREFNLDIQKDILYPIRKIEEESFLHGVSTSIHIYEFDPFIAEATKEDHCYYTSGIRLNIHSELIHHMSIRVGDTYFLCRKSRTPLDYSMVFGFRQFLDNHIYYPSMYLGKNSLLPGFLYGIMYMFGNQAQIKNIMESSNEFGNLVPGTLSRGEMEKLRKRLLIHKRINNVKTFNDYFTAFRSCLVGLTVGNNN